MGSSFSAASLVFLPAAAGTGIIAPDLLLFLRPGSGSLDVCKLFQKVKSHCLAGQFHCEDLLAEVLNVHFAGLEGLSDVRAKRERLEAFLRWRHLHHLIRRIATVAGHPRRIMKCTVQCGETLYIPSRPEPNTQLLQMVENIDWLNSNRTDTVQEFFKNSVFALVIQVATFFQECPQLLLFRSVLAVEGIIVFQQMLLVRHIVRLFLLASPRLHKKVDGLPNQGNVNDLAVKGLCVLDICVKLISAQNVVVLALMTGDLSKGKKFVF